jgi:hypothetical protein
MKTDMRESLFAICDKYGALLIKGSKARRAIKAIAKINDFSKLELTIFWEEPEKTLGPFEGLPTAVRKALAKAAQFQIRESYFCTSSLLFKLVYSPLFHTGANIIYRGWKLENRSLSVLGIFIVRLGRRLIFTSRFLGRVFLKFFRFTLLYKAPLIHTLWKYAKINPWSIIQNYIQYIPADASISPVFKCKKARVISCGLVGIDLLPSKGKLYFIESNFNPGHYMERHRLFPEGDTLFVHLVKWSAENRFHRIVFFPTNLSKPFSNDIEDAWQGIAKRYGVALEIIDDPATGSSRARRKSIFMDCESSGTLYVNGRYLLSPFSRLIGTKGLLEREIEYFNASMPSTKIFLPRRIISDDAVPPVKKESRFPNIIVKNIELDQTMGISLYKSQQLPNRANKGKNLAYKYIIPDLIVNQDEVSIKEYIYIFRAYLLVTPDGPVYLGARKDVSSASIPESLPYGIVKDKSPFVTNLHAGAYSVPHSEMEDFACKQMVLAIGRVVHEFLVEKYELTVASS